MNPLQPSKPEEISPSDLWLALTQVPRPSRTVPFPRNLPGSNTPVGELLITPLTQAEQMVCNAAADKFTKDLLKDPQRKDDANLGYQHTYANETAVQVLYRACKSPEDPSKAAFPSPKQMRELLTTDEIGVLFNQYCTVQAELGPIASTLSKEEEEALIVRLEEGGSAFPFDKLSWELQRTLVLSLASRVVKCWTAISTAGLPLDVGTFASERLKQLSEKPAVVEEAEPDAAPAVNAE